MLLDQLASYREAVQPALLLSVKVSSKLPSQAETQASSAAAEVSSCKSAASRAKRTPTLSMTDHIDPRLMLRLSKLGRPTMEPSRGRTRTDSKM
jgi:hypothetical protein